MDKYREEFEKHYLNLPFHDSKAAQKCLDSCDFDVKQNVYIPNAKWFDDNDADDGVIYCCMLNTAYMSFQHQQAKVEELQRRNQMLNDNIKEQGQKLVYQNEVIETQAEKLLGLRDEKAELQKRVDAALGHLDDVNFPPDYEDAWESFYKAEQALKGEGQ